MLGSRGTSAEDPNGKRLRPQMINLGCCRVGITTCLTVAFFLYLLSLLFASPYLPRPSSSSSSSSITHTRETKREKTVEEPRVEDMVTALTYTVRDMKEQQAEIDIEILRELSELKSLTKGDFPGALLLKREKKKKRRTPWSGKGPQVLDGDPDLLTDYDPRLLPAVSSITHPEVRREHPSDTLHREWVETTLETNPPRTLPDFRPKQCADLAYDFPADTSVSIIMCFHNEPLDRLELSVRTLLTRTVPSQLDHIIMLDEEGSVGDDAKQPKATKESVEALHLPKVTVLRNEPSLGIMRCRMKGAQYLLDMEEELESEIFIFLDSHIEASPGWLEPLLQAALVPGVSAVPITDIISDDDKKTYSRANVKVRGTLDWNFIFNWEDRPEAELPPNVPAYLPYKAPVMPGGLFAISVERWLETGQYDTGMSLWGGENIEMSLREWMCGGQIYHLPCSRVGHIYRNGWPYGTQGSHTAHKNYMRTIEVWIDEFKEVFTQKNSWARTDPGDVSERKQLRKDLGCKNFRWYLDHVNRPLRDSLEDKYQYLLKDD